MGTFLHRTGILSQIVGVITPPDSTPVAPDTELSIPEQRFTITPNPDSVPPQLDFDVDVEGFDAYDWLYVLWGGAEPSDQGSGQPELFVSFNGSSSSQLLTLVADNTGVATGQDRVWLFRRQIGRDDVSTITLRINPVNPLDDYAATIVVVKSRLKPGVEPTKMVPHQPYLYFSSPNTPTQEIDVGSNRNEVIAVAFGDADRFDGPVTWGAGLTEVDLFDGSNGGGSFATGVDLTMPYTVNFTPNAGVGDYTLTVFGINFDDTLDVDPFTTNEYDPIELGNDGVEFLAGFDTAIANEKRDQSTGTGGVRSTDNFRFGTHSLYFVGGADCQFLNDDFFLFETFTDRFTYEMWYYPTGTSAVGLYSNLINFGPDIYTFGLYTHGLNTMTMYHWNVGNDVNEIAADIPSNRLTMNAWNHLAWELAYAPNPNSVPPNQMDICIRMYLNGNVASAQFYQYPNEPYFYSGGGDDELWFGKQRLLAPYDLQDGPIEGYMDEIRLTPYVSRYENDNGLVVPTLAYPRNGPNPIVS